MDALATVATIPTIAFALVIAIVVTMFRRLVEIRWPTLSDKTPITKGQMIWEKLILPGVPVIFGVAFCVIASPEYFDYPPIAAKNLLSRVIYGVVIGWFADFGYRAFVFFLKRKWNVEMPGASDAPGPSEEAWKPFKAPSMDPPPVVHEEHHEEERREEKK